jgi:hypothetical protein
MALSQETKFPGDIRTAGRGIFGGGVDVGDEAILNRHVANGAGMEYSKLEHLHVIPYRQDGTVAAATVSIHMARGAGEILGIKASVGTHATGADREITIDLKAGAQGVAPVTQLTGTISIDENADDLEVFEGTLIGDPSYAANETLQLVVTVAGAAGAQAIGLLIEVFVREAAD